MSKDMKKKIDENKEQFLNQIAQEEADILEEEVAGGGNGTNNCCNSGGAHELQR